MTALERFAAAAKDQPGVRLPVPSCGDELADTLRAALIVTGVLPAYE